MQTTLRTKIAAAALVLAPLGALVASQPAEADVVRPAEPFVGYVHANVVGHRDDRHDRDLREHRDDRAPSIFEMTPMQGERLQDRGITRISARFSDDRSGIDPREVTLRVDGRDVTRQARIDRDDIRYADDLRPGRHFAELLVRDRAGNVARQAWSFEVAGRGWDREHDRGWDRGWDRDHDRRW